MQEISIPVVSIEMGGWCVQTYGGRPRIARRLKPCISYNMIRSGYPHLLNFSSTLRESRLLLEILTRNEIHIRQQSRRERKSFPSNHELFQHRQKSTLRLEQIHCVTRKNENYAHFSQTRLIRLKWPGILAELESFDMDEL